MSQGAQDGFSSLVRDAIGPQENISGESEAIQILKRIETLMRESKESPSNARGASNESTPKKRIPSTVRSWKYEEEADPVSQRFSPSPLRSRAGSVRKQQQNEADLTSKMELGGLLTPPIGNEFGEFRDHECVVPFSMTLTSGESFEATTRAISKWLSISMDILTKETFKGYSSGVPDSDCRLFICINLVLGYHSMSEFISKNCPQLWNKYSPDFVRHLQQSINESIEYYMAKYPAHAKILVPKEVDELMQVVNKSNIPVFNLFRRLKVALNPFRYFPKDYTEGFALHFNFRKDIRNLINACIQESKSKFDEFQSLMREVFLINTKVHDYTERKPIARHKIGMKFKRNMPLIPNNDSDGPIIEVNSSEVLRVLIKWIEELDDFLENPEEHILRRSNLEPFVVDPMYKDGWVEFLSEDAKRKLADELIALRTTLKQQGEWHSDGLNSVFHNLPAYVRAHKGQFQFLPKNTIRTGMAVTLLDAMTTETAIVYINRMLGLLYDCLCRAFPKGNKLLHEETARRLELVPFGVKDLLRAQCYGDIDEMHQVIHNISNDERVTIARVKNRLNTPNHDYLINFTFKGCRLICELQVGLDLKQKVEHKSEERKGFGHFLYELNRSKFGPLVQAALIINNVSEMGRYFRSKTKPCKPLEELNLEADFGSSFELSIPNFYRLDYSANFVCSICLQSKYAHRSFQPGWKKRGLQQYLCAKCIYDNLPAKHQSVYAMGGKHGSFFRVSKIEQVDLEPQYCIVSVDPLKYGQGTFKFYSSNNHQLPEEGTGLDIEKQGYISKESIQEEFPHKFFECFQVSSNTYFQKSILKGKLLLELTPLTQNQRIELVVVTERCENERDVLLHLASKLADIGQADNNPAFLWSTSLPANRSYQQTVVCLVDPAQNALLALDFQDRKRYQGVKPPLTNSPTHETLQKQKSMVNYEKSGYDEEVFVYLQYSRDVEELNLNENNFRSIDFLDAPNLRRLSLRLNRIDSLQVAEGKLACLRFLDLCGNSISSFEFDKVCLPELETLLLNFNYIGRVEFGANPWGRLSNLERLQISDNLLTDLNLEGSLISLKRLTMDNNKLLETLIVTTQRELISLEANCCCLSKFWIEGDFPALQKISLMVNNLSEVAVQEAWVPNLEELYLCYNRIQNFNLCATCPSLQRLDLSNLKLKLGFNNLKCLLLSDIKQGMQPRELSYISIYSTHKSGEIKFGETGFVDDNSIELYFQEGCTVDFGSKSGREKARLGTVDLAKDAIGRIWLMSYDRDKESELVAELNRTSTSPGGQELDRQVAIIREAFNSYVRMGKDGLEILSTFPGFELVNSAVELHSKYWQGRSANMTTNITIAGQQQNEVPEPPEEQAVKVEPTQEECVQESPRLESDEKSNQNFASEEKQIPKIEEPRQESPTTGFKKYLCRWREFLSEN